MKRIKPHHRRDWRRLWRYCRCGYRWRCPDSIELVPIPYAPAVPPLDRATYRAAVRASMPAVPPDVLDAPPPPVRARATNQRADGHLSGRAGNPTPAQVDRAQRARHARRVERV